MVLLGTFGLLCSLFVIELSVEVTGLGSFGSESFGSYDMVVSDST